MGDIAFAGIGLLIASRAQRIETVSGLMNLVMLPMWLLSGIFFSPDRFPAALQPLVQALPLTQLNYALRAIILEGASLYSQGLRIAVVAFLGRLVLRLRHALVPLELTPGGPRRPAAAQDLAHPGDRTITRGCSSLEPNPPT